MAVHAIAFPSSCTEVIVNEGIQSFNETETLGFAATIINSHELE
jgi:hypothetical protein